MIRSRRAWMILSAAAVLCFVFLYIRMPNVNAATVGYDSTCTNRRYNGVKWFCGSALSCFWNPETTPGSGGYWSYYATCPDCGAILCTLGPRGNPVCDTEHNSIRHDCYKTVSTRHSWSWVVESDATCTSPQYGHYRCANCGNVTETQASGNALGHAWSEWTVCQPATCTTNSMSHRSCSRCGASENRENTNASLGPVAFGHKYKETARTYPDAVTPGSITFVCQNDPSHTLTNAITLSEWNIYFKEGRVQKVALGDQAINLLYVGDTQLRSYVENGVDPITGERNRIL